MNQALLQRVVLELRNILPGRYCGKIYQLTPVSFAVDFGLRGEFLLIGVDPASTRLYLARRRTKELEKQALPLTSFGQTMRSKLGGGYLVGITKDPSDRIVRLTFRRDDESTGIKFCRLVIQLTGRTADLFILDELNRIVAILREQGHSRIGDLYKPPPLPTTEPRETISIQSGPPSAHLDKYFTDLDSAKAFDLKAKNVRSRLTKALRQQNNLQERLRADLERHGDPEEHKRAGDLLLANIATAIRRGDKVELTDYYAENMPTIELQVDQNRSLQDEAAARFRQYGKAKRAADEIAERLQQIDRDRRAIEQRIEELERIIERRDAEALESFEKPAPTPKFKPKSSGKPEKISGVRRYLSTDGYEVLVGRTARDNDNLTFRVAQPNDLWMHTGDYPGSHVVVRNPTRKEIPQRTVIEAAQLSGRFSQASGDARVVVHYTERKFVSKLKGAAPGTVRLSRFRSLTVEPKEGIERL